ncbi:MAG: hypothetical protein IPP37_07095 [Saprospiraceae bacterium]|nr:hypothetical protein [Saprospiraceae bacterium]
MTEVSTIRSEAMLLSTCTNDDLSDGTQATIANTTVTLIDRLGVAQLHLNVVYHSGPGVYTYNPAGILTFVPNPGFKPIQLTIK